MPLHGPSEVSGHALWTASISKDRYKFCFGALGGFAPVLHGTHANADLYPGCIQMYRSQTVRVRYDRSAIPTSCSFPCVFREPSLFVHHLYFLQEQHKGTETKVSLSTQFPVSSMVEELSKHHAPYCTSPQSGLSTHTFNCFIDSQVLTSHIEVLQGKLILFAVT